MDQHGTTSLVRRNSIVALIVTAAIVGTLASVMTHGAGASAATSSEIRQKIVDIARSQVGTYESGNNCNPYTARCESWCSDFASWVWGHAGVAIGSTAYSGSMYTWAQQHTVVRPPSGTPKIGDVALYGDGPQIDHDRNGRITKLHSTHVTIIVGVSGNKVQTIGGNEGKATDHVSFTDWHTLTGIYGYASPVNDNSPTPNPTSPGPGRHQRDFDGNGFDDVGVVVRDANGLASFQVLLTGADGKVAKRVDYGWSGYWGAAGIKTTVGDFTGDGRADFGVIVNNPNSLASFYVLETNPSTIKINRLLDYGWSGYWGFAGIKVTAADTTGDGRADFMVAVNNPNSLASFHALETNPSTIKINRLLDYGFSDFWGWSPIQISS